jgi:hypothetical protein
MLDDADADNGIHQLAVEFQILIRNIYRTNSRIQFRVIEESPFVPGFGAMPLS